MDKVAVILLKCVGTAVDTAAFARGLAALSARITPALVSMQTNRALVGAEAYIYCELGEAAALTAAAMRAIEQATLEVRELAGLRISAARLLCRFDRAGASFGAAAPFHYSVEFDPAEGWEAEIAAWYDTEHMPGLALVRGCVRARRFLNLDGGPRVLACYELVSLAARDSKAWQQMVATAWSSRVRPNFLHPKRTLFARTPAA
jgi:hypothetical protein